MSVVLVAGCDSIRSNAEQTFTPNTPGVLTVATTLPAPGFWNQDAHGTFTGGFEYEIAQALADRFGVTLDVVDVPVRRHRPAATSTTPIWPSRR